jgi:NAD(P)-dependent dehydrogenase (short-subunit alcohol dehydrogenase family)
MSTVPQTLSGKNIVIFGGSGSIGAATARHAAASGARVWVSGRREAAVKEAVDSILALGVAADVVTGDVVDATDQAAVDSYVDRVAADLGTRGERIDGTFNAIGATPTELGYPAVSTDLDLDTFLKPVHHILGSTFLTSRSVARHMARQGGGSIVTLSASISGSFVPWMAALTATCGAIEAMSRQLATEFGPMGIRVNCVRGDAMPDTRTIPLTAAGSAAIAGVSPEQFLASLPVPPLGPVSKDDTAATVGWLLSDGARTISQQVLDVSSRGLVG